MDSISHTMEHLMPSDIPVWTVHVNDGTTLPATFDDLDAALKYLRGYLANNGTPQTRVTLESRRMDPTRYAAEIEEEDEASKRASAPQEIAA
jgi:hypothetical protein